MWFDVYHALPVFDWPFFLAPTCGHVASRAPATLRPITTAVGRQGRWAAARVKLSIWRSWRRWKISSKGTASQLFHHPSNHIIVLPVAADLPPFHFKSHAQSNVLTCTVEPCGCNDRCRQAPVSFVEDPHCVGASTYKANLSAMSVIVGDGQGMLPSPLASLSFPSLRVSGVALDILYSSHG